MLLKLWPRFEKIDVNGINTATLYQWLRESKPSDEGSGAQAFIEKIQVFNPNSEANAIHWNFTKFLIDANGQVVHRYSPTVEPTKIKADILKLVK